MPCDCAFLTFCLNHSATTFLVIQAFLFDRYCSGSVLVALQHRGDRLFLYHQRWNLPRPDHARVQEHAVLPTATELAF